MSRSGWRAIDHGCGQQRGSRQRQNPMGEIAHICLFLLLPKRAQGAGGSGPLFPTTGGQYCGAGTLPVTIVSLASGRSMTSRTIG